MAAKKKLPAPREILLTALERKKKRNPSYSLRALARDLGLSAPFLSRMFKGEKPFPEDRFEQVVKALELDLPVRRLLMESILQQAVRKSRIASSVAQELMSSERQSSMASLSKYKEASSREFSVLDRWYNLAVLDLVTCVDFQPDPAWIARRLGIRKEEAAYSFDQLRNHGLVREHEGKWEKVTEHLRFPATKSHPSIRRYHQMMIQKAVEVMQTQTDERAFEHRMITSFTFAANSARIKEARERLNAALFEIVEILSEGECDGVYQINAQLFPLTALEK